MRTPLPLLLSGSARFLSMEPALNGSSNSVAPYMLDTHALEPGALSLPLGVVTMTFTWPYTPTWVNLVKEHIA
jgi:hypothetical protein